VTEPDGLLDREKVEAEAMIGLYQDPQFRRLYMARNNGYDPINLIGGSGASAAKINPPSSILGIMDKYK
jgi:hypothetical protein